MLKNVKAMENDKCHKICGDLLVLYNMIPAIAARELSNVVTPLLSIAMLNHDVSIAKDAKAYYYRGIINYVYGTNFHRRTPEKELYTFWESTFTSVSGKTRYPRINELTYDPGDLISDHFMAFLEEMTGKEYRYY